MKYVQKMYSCGGILQVLLNFDFTYKVDQMIYVPVDKKIYVQVDKKIYVPVDQKIYVQVDKKIYELMVPFL